MPDLVVPGAAAPHIALWEHPLADPNLEDARVEPLTSAPRARAAIPQAIAVRAATRFA